MTTKEVIPTIVPDSFDDLVAKQSVLGQFASTLHIDVADGDFAPNTTWLPSDEQLPDSEHVFYEAHMMVAEPQECGVNFARAGARRIIGHIEAFKDPEAARVACAAWRDAGALEIGCAVLLDTPLDALEPYLAYCDSVLFMTIATIGRQGIPFDTRSISRIAEFKARHPEAIIAVDGGVSEETIDALARAGATRFCVGSAIARVGDPHAAYTRLLERAAAV